jgi:malonyl-CoA/methylmalonyl-CoA synthetase
MLLYTSGTTGRPKGVVWRHAAIQAQVEMMSAAWEWHPDDRALLVLPLHHVHGLINVTTTALWNGAIVEMQPGFDAAAVWRRLGSGEPTVFMAVPTIYRRLLSLRDELTASERAAQHSVLSAMRLMVSGSAALPVSTLEAWAAASGHVLLERYGMTEIGMALSNSYRGERIPGAVGRPLPTVEARVVDDADLIVPDGVAGRLQIRGPSVFASYWRRPDETAASFVDGWFRTGDSVVVSAGIYRILGRDSVDIIKTGAEKVSALEIEDVLRAYPGIVDCAVVGLPDDDWGEVVAVAVDVTGPPPTLEMIRRFARDHLAPEKLPRALLVVDELPRNALGKVLKPQVRLMFPSPD